MPDGTVPSSTEAVRAALSAARASLERQLSVQRTDAAEDAMRQVQSALELMPSNRVGFIADAEWAEAVDVPLKSSSTTDATDVPAADGGSPPVASGDSDDLTRIRGIDSALASRLAALGIRRYVQIAAWQIEDVRVIADAMGLGRRFLAMGIVEQATDLLHRKAEVKTAARDVKAANARAAGEGSREVSIWQPPVPQSLVRASTPWQPLEGQDLARAVTAVRQHLPMNHIVSLAHLVPALAQPIYVPSAPGTAIELPRWRTGVLVPFVEATAPDLTRFSPGALRKDLPQDKPKPARTIVISAPTLDGFRPVAPPSRSHAEPPLHERATERLATIEAELETFMIAPPVHSPLAAAAASAPRTITGPRVAMPGRGASMPETGTLEDVPEAEVSIITGARPRPALLAPLPELPLKAPKTPVPPRDTEAPRGYHQVPEAAVVIVRRSGLPVAPAQKPAPVGGAVRRLLRAIAGR